MGPQPRGLPPRSRVKRGARAEPALGGVPSLITGVGEELSPEGCGPMETQATQHPPRISALERRPHVCTFYSPLETVLEPKVSKFNINKVAKREVRCSFPCPRGHPSCPAQGMGLEGGATTSSQPRACEGSSLGPLRAPYVCVPCKEAAQRTGSHGSKSS